MKAVLAFIALAACVLHAAAGELYAPISQSSVVYTNTTFSSNTVAGATNLVTLAYTNVQDCAFTIQQTFHLFNTATGTNLTTANLDRTLDGSNWIPVSTNTFTASGNYEYTASGKWAQYRWRISQQSTNSSLTALFMGQ